jgi:hypothetical protein
MIRDLGDAGGRREAEHVGGRGETGDLRSCKPGMLLACSVPSDPALLAIGLEGRRKGHLSTVVWAGATARGAVGWR